MQIMHIKVVSVLNKTNGSLNNANEALYTNGAKPQRTYTIVIGTSKLKSIIHD